MGSPSGPDGQAPPRPLRGIKGDRCRPEIIAMGGDTITQRPRERGPEAAARMGGGKMSKKPVSHIRKSDDLYQPIPFFS